ncbi:polysaccharide pyruvyl transferase family protein [Adhaeribacter arboris]|uniref:Polysaccharide pyruvyl transferase family protein n=1 Tax=Adhaeribacter arboris TaxID=2072846 RepID=A0A2T2YB54_9BACT|nr:polysaccharide pyruvyl transferase family protein [Adhaeribacter arboris]PSR52716.1 polysaccharide pyruvyl transferase family protein [Adhaeribacter arboris]
MHNRRDFLKKTAISALGALVAGEALASFSKGEINFKVGKQAPRHILLRSGWQTENIGDIAHTPGMLALLEKHLPEATVTFWPWYSYLPDEEVAMLKKRFPKLKIVQGTLSTDGKASTPELQQAIASADFFLHNSGPATIAWQDAATFKKITGKPFGVFGVTYGLYGTPETATLSEAAFVYLRDSVSLKKVKELGVRSPDIKFVPDAVFAFDITDDGKALPFLKQHGLEKEQFLVCLPKQRHTPSWLHQHKNRPIDPVKHARNEEMKEHDHLPLREAITAIVRQTNHRILIGNEDETEQSIGKDWVFDKLPDDVKPRVIWLNRHWAPDEALSVYKQSAGLFGLEMHSPIMCIAQGIPAIVGRWEEQSSKGYMWQDIGLGEWLFDFDKEAEVKQFVPTVLALAKDTQAAKAKAKKARQLTQTMHKNALQDLEKVSRPQKQG